MEELDNNDDKNSIFSAIIIGHQRVGGCNYSMFNNVNLYDRFILIFGGLRNRRLHILQEGMHSFPSDTPLRRDIFLKDILKSTVCLVSSVKRVGHTTWYFFEAGNVAIQFAMFIITGVPRKMQKKFLESPGPKVRYHFLKVSCLQRASRSSEINSPLIHEVFAKKFRHNAISKQ